MDFGEVRKNQKEKKIKNKIKVRQFENKLIMEIKNHSCLYAKNEASYSNKFKRDEAWQDIAMILCKTVEECQKKWTALRDAFRAYFRNSNNIPTGSGGVVTVKWIHFQSLKFLIPYLKVPGEYGSGKKIASNGIVTRSSIVFTPIESNKEENIVSAMELRETPVDLNIGSVYEKTNEGSSSPDPLLADKRRSKKRILIQQIMDDEKRKLQILEQILQKDDQFTKNPLISFFTQMGEIASVKLPPTLQIEAKRLLVNLMCDLEQKALNMDNISSYEIN